MSYGIIVLGPRLPRHSRLCVCFVSFSDRDLFFRNTYAWACMKQASVLRIHDGAGQNFSKRSRRFFESSLPGSTGSSRLARTATGDVCLGGIVFGGVRRFAVSVWVLLFYKKPYLYPLGGAGVERVKS